MPTALKEYMPNADGILKTQHNDQYIVYGPLRVRDVTEKQKVGQDIQLSPFDCLSEFAVWNGRMVFFIQRSG